MWYWEVLWKDSDDNIHSFFSLKGYSNQVVAVTVLSTNMERIKSDLKSMGCVQIVDQQIVYKVNGSLYQDGGIL